MPFNGLGTFTRAVSAYVFNTVISEVTVNTEMDDIAAGLSNAITKDGQTTITDDIPFNGHKLTGLGKGTSDNHAVTRRQLTDAVTDAVAANTDAETLDGNEASAFMLNKPANINNCDNLTVSGAYHMFAGAVGSPDAGKDGRLLHMARNDSEWSQIAIMGGADFFFRDKDNNTDPPFDWMKILTSSPYDIPFNAGFDSDIEPEDLEVRDYGTLILARAITVDEVVVNLQTRPSGRSIIFDITRNGSSIYSNKPSISTSGAYSKGTIRTTSLAKNSRLVFKVTRVGSGTKGKGLRIGIQGHV